MNDDPFPMGQLPEDHAEKAAHLRQVRGFNDGVEGKAPSEANADYIVGFARGKRARREKGF